MLDCAAFLEEYSGFRDGLLDEQTTEAFEHHRNDCAFCRRYDRVVRQGAQLLSSLPTLEPSPEFSARLAQRLDRVDAEARERRSASESGVPVAALLGIAATLMLAAWGPLLQQQERALFRLPPIAAQAPQFSPQASYLQYGSQMLDEVRVARWAEPMALPPLLLPAVDMASGGASPAFLVRR